MVYLSNIFFLYHDTVTCSMSATRLRIFLLDLIFSPVVGCGGCVDDDWYVWYDLSIYLSVCLSIYLPIYLSIYLSILSCLVLSSLILSYLISLSIYMYDATSSVWSWSLLLGFVDSSSNHLPKIWSWDIWDIVQAWGWPQRRHRRRPWQEQGTPIFVCCADEACKVWSWRADGVSNGGLPWMWPH